MFKLLRYAKKYIVPALISPIFMIGEVIFELMIPLVMADIVNLIQAEGFSDASLNQMLKYGLRMLIYAVCSLCCGTLAARAAAVAGMGFGAKLRENMMGKIQTFSFSNIDRFSTASLITRLTTDVTNIQNVYQMMIRMCVRSPFMLIAHSIGILLASTII